MKEHAGTYIRACINIGILTAESSREFPLRSANLAMVLKAYAIETNQPFSLDTNYGILNDDKFYLSDGGLEWLYSAFSKHSLSFLRHSFQFVFTKATHDDVQSMEAISKLESMNNFKGLTGDAIVAGTKQKALLIRRHGKNHKIETKFYFDSIRDARLEIPLITRFYPADEFTLYRLRSYGNNGKTYKEKIALYITNSNRGAHLRGGCKNDS